MANSTLAQFRPFAAGRELDAHGRVALLLAENTRHMLVETGLLANTDALDVVRTAAEVKLEIATAEGESEKRIQQSLTLLQRIFETFRSNEFE